MAKIVLLAATLAAFSVVASASAVSAIRESDDKLTFRVCGNYCGPDWCANKVITEQQCVATGVWGMAGSSTVDTCCRTHDYCCGSGQNRPACNTALVSCIQSNGAILSWCGAAVWAAMKTVSNWCCGSPCPTYLAEGETLSLEEKEFCSADKTLRIRFEGGEAVVERPGLASCTAQSYTIDSHTNLVHIGTMMAGSMRNECGLALSTRSATEPDHPLLLTPETILYLPYSKAISISAPDGSVATMDQC